jgi:hypothetical protein
MPPEFAYFLMLLQNFDGACLNASFVLVYAKVLDVLDNLQQNGTDADKFDVPRAAIRALVVSTLEPVVDACTAEELVLAAAALHWPTLLKDYLIANAAKDYVLHILDIIGVHNS